MIYAQIRVQNRNHEIRKVDLLMRKHFRRSACVLLLSLMTITGIFSPVARFAPHAIRSVFITAPAHAWTFGLDTLISLLAGYGAVGLTIVIMTAVGGIAAGGTFMAVLATLGGPFGVIGGIIGMGAIAIIAKGIADEGLDYILIRFAQKWKAEGKTLAQIEREINELPSVLINDSRKAEVIRSIRPYMK